MAKVGFISLGCAKNLVDSEVMMGLLAESGFEITSAQREADVIVVNTCGFIDRAKEESVDAILEMAREKERGKCRRLIVAGCLVERYRDQILKEIPEVDAVVGVNEIPEILKVCAGEAMAPAFERRELYLYSDLDPRLRTTPSHSAYVKIAEGCDHPCTFCVIPKMRGRFRSRSIESVVSEARRLAEQGVREVNLVAQDSTMFGWDRGDRKGLAQLLSQLNGVDGLEWIRFLYAYPNKIYDELLVTIAESEKVCKYMDVPLQHASREILRRMKRGGNRSALSRLIARIRTYIPDVTIRTTMIVGFPGETEEDFRDLLEFVEEARFDRLGAFTYSDEEDAESFRLEGRVPKEVKVQRKQRLMELQSRISQEKNRELIGRVAPVLIEGPSRETDLLWEGRLQGQAPEIDGVVYLNDGVSADTRPGDFGRVSITEAHPHDLVGALVS
ncbi:MAG TPA: 30S ribosomal protein S12 methylthiotransferase RimO [Acidobacteriota bacterium]|nr:30S ribosomal protein S12 methylthiotransferase RimO [Acidobacteriota bacterium]